MWNTNTMLTLAWILSGKKGNLILTEHGNLSYHLKDERFVWLKKTLIRLLHPKSSKVVAGGFSQKT